MSTDASKDRAPPFGATPRWLTPRKVVLGVLFLGTAALAFTRIDASPGAIGTAVMLLAAWSPMALPLRRPSVRRVSITWTTSVALLHLTWWVHENVFLDSSHLERFATGCAMVALLAGFRFVWRTFHREAESPAGDSAGQLAVIAGAWVALAGCIGTLDAVTRLDRVLGRIQVAESAVALGTACVGVLVAVVAVRRLRRRVLWIERVGEGSVEGWVLVDYTPVWGDLAAIPRLIGGAAPSKPASTCLLVREPLAQQRQDAGYRGASARANGAVFGRLDATPRMGGLNAALRGEDGLLGLFRTLAITFAVTMLVPAAIFAIVLVLYALLMSFARR